MLFKKGGFNLGYDDDKNDLKRLQEELELQRIQRNISRKRGKASFSEWIKDLLKSLFNIVITDIIGRITDWLWEVLFGEKKK